VLNPPIHLSQTSVWRQSRLIETLSATVCNACGLYELKNGKRRPKELIERSMVLSLVRNHPFSANFGKLYPRPSAG
jgi:hypothetical protein